MTRMTAARRKIPNILNAQEYKDERQKGQDWDILKTNWIVL